MIEKYALTTRNLKAKKGKKYCKEKIFLLHSPLEDEDEGEEV